jgi:ATP-binding cassette subfamily B protein
MMLSWPARDLGWILNLAARAGSCGDRIFEVLDAPSGVEELPGAPDLPKIKGHLKFEGISFGYDSRRPVLKDISFEARPGQMIALVGRTGAGKSSLVNLVPRFYDPDAGRITIDGVDIRQVSIRSLRRQIGIVLQESFLFSTTIRDVTRQAVENAARAARAHEFIVNLADGYDTVIGERGITLSGGQRQRLSIARTLLLDTPILIMDDSTSCLDTETEYLVQEALQQMPEGYSG